MIDKNNVWMVVENEDEREYAKKLIDKIEEFKSISVSYKKLKQLLILDYIEIGRYKDMYEMILGHIKINDYVLSVEGFEPKIILNNKYFKPFFKQLIKGLKMRTYTEFIFYYNDKKHIVVVVVENRVGLIARVYPADLFI